VDPAINKSDKKWTYADYLTWDDGQRWELFEGEAHLMYGPVGLAPAPNRHHQELSGELFYQLFAHLKGKPCKVYGAPFDVRLADMQESSDNYVETVVQPDIVVVCDKAKLDERGCNGAPDLVIEIISPSTAKVDLTVKFDLYQKYGVKEYWIVHPMDKTLMVFKLQADGRYGSPDRYADDGRVPVPLLGDLVIDLAEVFSE
jgi:Uma2 family endonuclease